MGHQPANLAVIELPISLSGYAIDWSAHIVEARKLVIHVC
eukprot:XP_001706399.1 Hypothetical protein GL50803_34890 [Giardia lamblia ATCC 50803]